ncbi:DUF1963 domain-containing protein [Lysinibacillus cavernae]|uniref:DUF1963 domain-containing protein n=1 Tax=Lysinibacillus cavernae TaxID=2666135 RepID=UPI0012D8738B|nr:DUF1963 domain-containing protein [Lysinibacillus cavernae]
MAIEHIRARLAKQATIFQTGGIRPTHDLLESWIGSVGWSLPEEHQPTGYQPLATLFLKDLPYVPTALQSFQLVTLFVNEDLFDHLMEDDLRPYFEIRTYSDLEGLVKRDWQHDQIRAFPLIPKLITNDYPLWDGGGIPAEIEEEILSLEHEEELDYFDDIVEDLYPLHKMGGYPTFCQSGFDFGEDTPFVFQIASDAKAKLNIVDNGNFYFFYNPTTQTWHVYCDFY